MSAVFPFITQSGHPINRVVQYQSGADLRGFLMTKKLAGDFDASYPPGNQGYAAYFNDGTKQDLPGGYVPPGGPASTDKVKNYQPPPQLTAFDADKVRPSMFTGLMRLMVGTYHRAGKDAPLNYKWEKTHGIIKATHLPPPTIPPNPDPEFITSYWIIEVSPGGLYVAPLKVVKNFQAPPSLEAYMPTTAEVAANPGLQQYRDKLNLQWAYGAKNSTFAIQRFLEPGEVTPYNFGSPWWPGHGWAFSASGWEFQNVVVSAGSSPSPHYKCYRFKIKLKVDDYGFISMDGGIVTVENGLTYVPWVENILWVPTEPGIWAGVSASSSNPIDADFPTFNAPIFVYYVGDEEKVVRATKGGLTTTPAFQSPPVVANSTTSIPWNQMKWGFADLVDVHNCVLFITQKCPALTVDGGTGTNDGAFTSRSRGFMFDEYDGTKQYYSGRSRAYHTTVTIELANQTGDPFGNSYELDPECYYTNPATGATVTVCSSMIQPTTYYKYIYVNREDYVETVDWRTACVLFMEEREAALFVERGRNTKAGSFSFGEIPGAAPTYTYRYRTVTIKTDTGPCPHTDDDDFNGSPVFYTGTVPPIPVSSGSYPATDTFSRAFALVADKFLESGAFSETNFNLETFLSYSPFGKTTAESNVYVICGNMVEADSIMKPPDQMGNAVYRAANYRVDGGFALPTEASIAFVGKA